MGLIGATLILSAFLIIVGGVSLTAAKIYFMRNSLNTESLKALEMVDNSHRGATKQVRAIEMAAARVEVARVLAKRRKLLALFTN